MPETSLILLPMPREITYIGDPTTLRDNALIVIPSADLLFEAYVAQRALSDFAGVTWQVVVGASYNNAGLTLAIDNSIQQPQGYQLTIKDHQITIQGADPAGLFYGVCTFRQILQQLGKSLPELTISDWPDFPVR